MRITAEVYSDLPPLPKQEGMMGDLRHQLIIVKGDHADIDPSLVHIQVGNNYACVDPDELIAAIKRCDLAGPPRG